MANANGLGRGLFQFAKETMKMSKVITTEMLNPFHWAKSKKVCNLIVILILLNYRLNHNKFLINTFM